MPAGSQDQLPEAASTSGGETRDLKPAHMTKPIPLLDPISVTERYPAKVSRTGVLAVAVLKDPLLLVSPNSQLPSSLETTVSVRQPVHRSRDADPGDAVPVLDCNSLIWVYDFLCERVGVDLHQGDPGRYISTFTKVHAVIALG